MYAHACEYVHVPPPPPTAARMTGRGTDLIRSVSGSLHLMALINSSTAACSSADRLGGPCTLFFRIKCERIELFRLLFFAPPGDNENLDFGGEEREGEFGTELIALMVARSLALAGSSSNNAGAATGKATGRKGTREVMK